MEWSFRKAIKGDAEKLVILVNSAYRGESSKKGWTTEADYLDGARTDLEGILEMMERPGACIIVAERANEIFGCVFLQKQEEGLYLGMLTVNPDLQGSGLGKQILNFSEEYAKKEDCQKIFMNVITLRHELISWYERKGYHTTTKRNPFPTDPRFGIPKQEIEFLVMEKEMF